jgi:DNA-directed RNA polymerase delta subunit
MQSVYRIQGSSRMNAVKCKAMSGDAFQEKVKEIADKRRNIDKRRLKDVKVLYNQFKDIARVELKDAVDILRVVVPLDKINEEVKAAASKCKDASKGEESHKASVDSTIDI